MISLTGKAAQLISQIEGCLTQFFHTHTHTIGSPLSLTLSLSDRGFPETRGLNFVLVIAFSILAPILLPTDPFWPSE